ncbi:hypothetical protein L2E82_36526 [Cichorium intybus]|uniref:Uncharacterized protein n=1 Tax=Cichorium intybus TaxID=13427 RepID=A0ACB9BRR0_CICIN|nr:hypothetical protein L2E82_36526 [Cichorium intybus]
MNPPLNPPSFLCACLFLLSIVRIRSRYLVRLDLLVSAVRPTGRHDSLQAGSAPDEAVAIVLVDMKYWIDAMAQKYGHKGYVACGHI